MDYKRDIPGVIQIPKEVNIIYTCFRYKTDLYRHIGCSK